MSAFNNVRALRALNLRRNGAKLKDMAVMFGVSRERARQLVNRGYELERQMAFADPWDELSARARNALIGWSCKPSLDGVLERYNREAYAWGSLRLFLMRIPNISTKTTKEITDWLTRHNREIP